MKRHVWQPSDIKNPDMRRQAEAALAVPRRDLSQCRVDGPAYGREYAQSVLPPRKTQSHKTGVMNGEERRFADHLERIDHKYRFEAIKLRLADGCSYTPDFYLPEWRQFCEVKAWWKGAGRVGWREDARIKIKMAAELFTEFEFCAVWWRADRGRFEYEWFGKPESTTI